MNVLITGANGFVGLQLVKKFLSKGDNVFAIDLFSNNLESIQSKNLHIFSGGIDFLTKNIDIFRTFKIDCLYHFAWRGVNGKEKSDFDIQLDNIKMTLECCKFAKAIFCKKILISGTLAEQNFKSFKKVESINGSMIYGTFKKVTNDIVQIYCKSVGLDLVWMQFSNIYGENNYTGNLISYTIDKIKKNEKALFGPCNQIYDFIHIDDLIEAVYRLSIAKENAGFYFIGSGKPRLLKDYLVYIGKVAKKEDLICIGSRPFDGIEYTLDMFDISNLVKDIGYYVTKSFDDEIKKMLG